MFLNLAVVFASRMLLVLLFLPFSAMDKLLNFRGAVAQARQVAGNQLLAVGLILVGLCVEITLPLCILSGFADRLAAFVMAGYCGVTAILWKQFWKPGDFWSGGKGRDLFWDFLKNFAVAGGFLMLTWGGTAQSVGTFIQHPLSSTAHMHRDGHERDYEANRRAGASAGRGAWRVRPEAEGGLLASLDR